MNDIHHPLAVDTKVLVNRPSCQCKGAKITQVTGTIKKIINNHKGTWYYLDIGYTVSSEWILQVVK